MTEPVLATACDAADAARTALFHAEPTTVLGVVAMLEAMAKDDSPIEQAINSGAVGADNVNKRLRRLADVLREIAA
jgi:hypothetical protein